MSEKTNEELAAWLYWMSERDVFVDEAVALRTAAARLRQQSEDSARLDWLLKRCTGASDSERYLPFCVYWGDGRDAREAIDKARKA